MSHHIYHTEGIVLGGFDVGESNRFLFIFTKDLGLLGASAQGIRALASKLRYSIQYLSYARIDLVRGKDVWRVTSAEKIHDHAFFFPDKEKRDVVVKTASLLRRMCVGEEAHEALFGDIISGLSFLSDETFTKDELRSLEMALVLKILYHLGYWGKEIEFARIVYASVFSREVLDDMRLLAPSALKEINRALKASHL